MAQAVRGQQGQAGGARHWERTGGAGCALFLQPEHRGSQPGGLPACLSCCYMDLAFHLWKVGEDSSGSKNGG